MAEVLIQRACERFRKEVSAEEAKDIESTEKIGEVRSAIQMVERQLAARGALRNIGRISPFVDAIERYSTALDTAANGTPYLPWIWAPIKFVLKAVQDCTNALEKILVCYSKIGSHMPRFTRFAGVFPKDHEFQQLLAFLFEDIIDFHRKAYSMIRKPGWRIFFSSAWGGFEYRFSSLISNIGHTSDQIDREAASLNISQAVKWRIASAEDAEKRQDRWQTQQLNAVLNWLETADKGQEVKLEWLKSRCYEGTSQWVLQSPKLRSWLQRGRGRPVLWLYGKPGSGKSVIASQIITFLRSDPHRNVCFFFCDFHTPSLGIGARILRAFSAQLVRASQTIVPYLYDECVSKGQKASTDVLRKVLPQVLTHFDDLRLLVDGIDEVAASEHRVLINDLLGFTEKVPGCKILIVSQDIPSIAGPLSRKSIDQLSLANEKERTQKDLEVIIEGCLQEIDEQQGGMIEENDMKALKISILNKAEGMFIWVHLVLELLRNASSLYELRQQVDSLPKDLAEAYKKILSNICNRCSSYDVGKIKRIFTWLMFRKGRHALPKSHVRIGMALHPGCEVLTVDKKPFINATDICKPLVEDGPGGSVIFVHSTVPQFLVGYGPDPFISTQEAHLAILFACMSQLAQGLDLLNKSLPISSVMTGVALGLYGLLPYTIEYVVDHLQEFLLDGQAGNLIYPTALDSISEAVYRKASELGVVLPRISVESLCLPQSLAFIKNLIRLLTDIGPNQDRNLLGDILAIYKAHVHRLLDGSEVESVSQRDIIAFKEEFGPTAWACEVPGCDRAVIGFPSHQKLKDHQVRQHQTLRCLEKDCLYNDIGFVTEKALKDHKRKRHATTGLARVPKRLRAAAPQTRRHSKPDLEIELVKQSMPSPSGIDFVVAASRLGIAEERRRNELREIDFVGK
ncbi:hypothetical protein F4779DRAFT_609911 [Xylariaceae sp. FL0662B]|nr:hypothetical protein F4779DRAFT_609911 [Xylariaceae sp. FL0662B]